MCCCCGAKKSSWLLFLTKISNQFIKQNRPKDNPCLHAFLLQKVTKAYVFVVGAGMVVYDISDHPSTTIEPLTEERQKLHERWVAVQEVNNAMCKSYHALLVLLLLCSVVPFRFPFSFCGVTMILCYNVTIIAIDTVTNEKRHLL